MTARRLARVKASRVESGVDRARVRALKNARGRALRGEHPRSAGAARARPAGRCPTACRWPGCGSYHHLPLWVAEGHGARFTDVDGHEYGDFNIADMSMFCGYGPSRWSRR